MLPRSQDYLDTFNERAAKLQFDEELPQEGAERQAANEVCAAFALAHAVSIARAAALGPALSIEESAAALKRLGVDVEMYL